MEEARLEAESEERIAQRLRQDAEDRPSKSSASTAAGQPVATSQQMSGTNEDDRLAGILEADLPPLPQVGLSSAAMTLMEFQREARSCFTMEVASVLVDVLLAVERGHCPGSGKELVTPFVWRPKVALRRNVIERTFRLMIREEVQAVRPPWLTRRDSASIVRHVENHRKDVVEFSKLQQPKSGYRPQQLRLLGVRTKAELAEVIEDRRMEIVTALSDGYLRVRVAVLRTWIQFCVEGRGESPWRTHWPVDSGDDQMMADYLVVLSLRYTDFGVVEASLMHIVEFHQGFLRVPPPSFHVARWTLSKIKRILAIEFPLGRTVRPGLLMEHVQSICAKLRELVLDESVSLERRRFYVNVGSAISATRSPALRTGETCPGDGWNAADYWSRMTVSGMLDADVLARPDVDSVLIRAMKRKTVYMSSVAREKANLPILYDAKASHVAAFAVWGPLLQRFDPCSPEEAPFAPAFREGGPYSDALSTAQLRETMRAIAMTEVPGFADFDYGMHSLRIGREAELRGADVRPELINDITSHTTVGGRAPYSRVERSELLKANRLADEVVVKPLETAVRFGADRAGPGQNVFLSPDGEVVGAVAAEARSSVPVVKLTKRERTAGPMLVDFFKKPKRSGVG